ncbi:hypothetical protein FOZ63_007735, partial [Perkinsus olseni]
DIARLFDKTNLMPLFTTVMLFAAFATGAVHARVAAPFSYRQRVGLAMIIQSIGYLLFGTAFLLVGVQSEVGFWMAQLATFLVGAFQTIGEINNLSILNSLPNGLVGAWGFGTGVSQFVGSISYVIAINLGISYSTFFLGLIPVYLVYWALFLRVEKLARLNEKEHAAAEDALLTEESRKSLKLTSKTFPNVFRMGGIIILNMAATYAFNYLIESGFADRATLHPEPFTAAVAVNSYALGVSVYGIGTMLARLSVAWFPTSRIGLITILQLINSVLWGFEAYYHTIRSFGLPGWWFYQFWMFFVGWIAGMSYSNCLNVIGLSTKTSKDVEEAMGSGYRTPVPPHARYQIPNDILYVDELSLCSNTPTEESVDLDPTWENVGQEEKDTIVVPTGGLGSGSSSSTRAFKNASWMSVAYITAIMLILFGRLNELPGGSLVADTRSKSTELVIMQPSRRSACEVLMTHLNNSELFMGRLDRADDDRLVWNTKDLGIAGAWKFKSLVDEILNFPDDPILKWQGTPKNVRKWRDGWNIEFSCSLDDLFLHPSEGTFVELGALITEVAQAARETKVVRNFVSKSLIKLAAIISPEAEMQCGYNDRKGALKMAAFAWKRKHGWEEKPIEA